MLTKNDLQQIAKLIRNEVDDAIANFAKIIMDSMASKDDLKALATKDDLKALATKDDLKYLDGRIDLLGSDLRTVKEDVRYLKEKMVLPEAFNNLTQRVIKLEDLHQKEFAYV